MSKLAALKSLATLTRGRSALYISNNSPTILLAAGIGGFVGTVVLSSRATLKATKVVENAVGEIEMITELVSDKSMAHHKNEYTVDDFKSDRVYIYYNTALDLTKLYLPTVFVGAFSIYCLAKSHQILQNRNVALAAAYTALDKTYRAYRKKVEEKYGEEAERDIYYNVERKEVESIASDGTIVITEKKKLGPKIFSEYARFFDQTCPDWQKVPEYNYLYLRAKQNYANDILRSRGHIFLNEVYSMLGMEHSYQGAVVGWVLSDDGSTDNYVDFGFMDPTNASAREFVNGDEGAILLDFNVDGIILGKTKQLRRP